MTESVPVLVPDPLPPFPELPERFQNIHYRELPLALRFRLDDLRGLPSAD